MSYYIHDVPGRLRVKTPLIKSRPQMADEVRTALGAVTGINSVTVNTVTGSIVIYYDARLITSKAVLDILIKKKYFDITRAVTNDQYIHSAASKAGMILGRALFGVFVEKALEGSALSLLAVLI